MTNAKTSQIRAALKTGAASLVMSALLAGPAFAQTDAADASTGEAETIVVTGSRIARPNLEGSSPVTVINNAEVKLTGTTRVEDLVNSLPQAFAQQGGSISNGATGTATVNLRNLGPQRTLVLMNGRRLTPGDPFQPVADLNAIPAALIERVDVLTGGASSVYGADAVAGVVNFVMDSDFEGFRVDAQYSLYQHNNNGDERIRSAIRNRVAGGGSPSDFPLPDGQTVDGATFDTTISFGVGTDDGRGHLSAYAGYRKIKPVLQANYDYSACAISADVDGSGAPDGNEGTTGAGFVCAGSNTGAPGRIRSFTDSGLGTRLSNVNPTPGTGAFRTYSAARDAYNFAPTNYYQRPDERFTMGAFAEYEINDFFKPYLELQFMDDRTRAQIAPSGAFGTQVDNFNCSTNPLLSAAQAATLCGGQQTVSLVVNRRNVEGGGRIDDLRHTNYRIVVGTKGDLTENWTYDIYGQFGRTVFQRTYLNDFSIARLQRALTVVTDPSTGQPVCASVLDGTDLGCVPYNIFSGSTSVQSTVQQGVTAAALAYLQTPGFQNGQTTEQIISASVSGDLGTFSPFTDDTLGVALGVEYRKQDLELRVDEAFRTGDLSGQGGPTLPNEGGYDVKEVFGEVRVPVVSDAPFFQELSLEAGYRYSDYSLSSPNSGSRGFSTDTYKFGIEWAPVDGVRLRGSYNRAVRAPNLVELYTGQGLGLWAGTDPCTGATPAFTLAQCQRTGLSAALYGNVDPNPAAQYNALLSGNPDLDPEVADTFTAGVVFAPKGVLSGFTASIDAYDIKVKDYIILSSTLGLAQAYLLGCGLSGNAEFCSRIVRNPGTGQLDLANLAGTVGFVRDENVNTGELRTRGIDFAADYRMDIGEGGLAFNFVGTYTDMLRYDTGIPIALSPTATPTSRYDCAGYYGVTCGVPTPKWRHKLRVTYSAPSVWQASLAWRYVGSVKDEQTQTENPYLSPNGAFYRENAKLKAENYFDLALTADVTEMATFRFGVNNILDNDPPLVSQESLSATFGNGNTYPQVYDALGRYFYIGATFSF